MRPRAGTGNRGSGKDPDFPGIISSVPARNRATVTVRGPCGCVGPHLMLGRQVTCATHDGLRGVHPSPEHPLSSRVVTMKTPCGHLHFADVRPLRSNYSYHN